MLLNYDVELNSKELLPLSFSWLLRLRTGWPRLPARRRLRSSSMPGCSGVGGVILSSVTLANLGSWCCTKVLPPCVFFVRPPVVIMILAGFGGELLRMVLLLLMLVGS